MMLDDLPVEMVLSIADQLDSQSDINSLSRINRRFNTILTPCLYRYNVRYCKSAALYWAVTALNLETAKQALDAGADVNAPGPTPLGRLNAFHLAVRSRQDIKRRLMKKIKRESEYDYRKRVGKSPCKAHDSMVKLLLERGADINSILHGWSALAIAVHQPDPHLARVLVAREPDPHLARLLVANGADANKAERHGGFSYTILHNAVENCGPNLIRILLEKGASVHWTDKLRSTPLHCAIIKRRSKRMIRLLVESGADIEARQLFGHTPLHLAAKCGQVELIQLLIKCGADIGARDPNGRTALHIAAGSESSEPIRLLIEYGADIEARDDIERTPLHYAAHIYIQDPTRRTEPVRVLLEYGADVNAKDMYGSRPIHLALYSFDNAKLLAESGAEIGPETSYVEALKKHATECHSRDINEKPATHRRRSTRLAKKQCTCVTPPWTR
ncbi:hypothetical protein FQN50_006910 [Emmonsiellopsis sp. PD_5]|nr:hypothetical protein FQN50_006910 [Emmonsiellopsis sp. PD_5]